MTVIAFVTEAGSIKRILEYLGQPTTPAAITPARGPPRLETMTSIKTPKYDPAFAQRAPDYELDQTISW